MGIIEQWRKFFFVQIIAPCIEECLIQYVLNAFEKCITPNQELQELQKKVRWPWETWDKQRILSDLDIFRDKILCGITSKFYKPALELLERIVKTWIEARQILTRIQDKEVAVFEATKREYNQKQHGNFETALQEGSARFLQRLPSRPCTLNWEMQSQI